MSRATTQPTVAAVLGVVAALALCAPAADAQLSYRSDQPVSTAFEGWEEEEDGSRYFLFGYMNANWEQEPDVPIGPNNYFVVGDAGTGRADPAAFDPAVADQGQPTHFLPRRNRFVFKVPVPADFRESDEVIWTLTANDNTVSAYASLRLDYRVDSLIKASEQGAIGAGTTNPVIRANVAPTLRVEGPVDRRTVRVGEPVVLTAVATDDGVPKATQPRRSTDPFGRGAADVPAGWMKPRQITVGSATGLRVSWYVYRGEGEVSFAPEQIKVWEDTRVHANSPWANYWYPPALPDNDTWEVEVTFDEPGTYVLRCLASDGALGVDGDVTVIVTP